MDIDIIINKLELKYFSGLNTCLIKNNSQITWLSEHINKLNGIVNSDTETQLVKKNENIGSPKIMEENLYNKSWSKLNAIHKIIKIKEFVNNIKIDNINDKEKLKDELVDLVKSKILTKKDKITYDEENGKIISIKNLQYKDGKYFYPNE
jgi:phosphatidate phosphatase PAH1